MRTRGFGGDAACGGIYSGYFVYNYQNNKPGNDRPKMVINVNYRASIQTEKPDNPTFCGWQDLNLHGSPHNILRIENCVTINLTCKYLPLHKPWYLATFELLIESLYTNPVHIKKGIATGNRGKIVANNPI